MQSKWTMYNWLLMLHNNVAALRAYTLKWNNPSIVENGLVFENKVLLRDGADSAIV